MAEPGKTLRKVTKIVRRRARPLPGGEIQDPLAQFKKLPKQGKAMVDPDAAPKFPVKKGDVIDRKYVPRLALKDPHMDHMKFMKWKVPRKEWRGLVVPEVCKKDRAKLIEFLEDSVDFMDLPTRLVHSLDDGTHWWCVFAYYPGTQDEKREIRGATVLKDDNGDWTYRPFGEIAGGYVDTTPEFLDDPLTEVPDEIMNRLDDRLELHKPWRKEVRTKRSREFGGGPGFKPEP